MQKITKQHACALEVPEASPTGTFVPCVLDIQEKSQVLMRDYSDLAATSEGVKEVYKGALRGAKQLTDLLQAINSLSDYERIVGADRTHPLSKETILEAREVEDMSVPFAVRAWRRNPCHATYASIDEKDRKEIFDYFFRHCFYFF